MHHPFVGFARRSMRTATLSDRLRYRFDNTISKGTVALIGWLSLVLLALVLASTLFVYATGIAPETAGHRSSFFETLWLGLMRPIDSGNLGGDRGSWLYLLSMLTVTAGGIFVFSTLIGVIFASIDEKLADLRKGRSFVVERGHTVIYGWSPEVFPVVAENDKVEMEDEIRARLGKTGNQETPSTSKTSRSSTPTRRARSSCSRPKAPRPTRA